MVRGARRAAECAAALFDSGLDTRVVVERYAGDGGREFTVIVLGTRDGPVPLIPTEVEVSAPDERDERDDDENPGGGGRRRGRGRGIVKRGAGDGVGGGGVGGVEGWENAAAADEEADDSPPPEHRGIFNFRRKYLPTMQVAYHTPARFGTDAVEQIRASAAETFRVLGLRDFARLDGFFMPEGDPAVDWGASAVQAPSVGRSAAAAKGGHPVFTDVNIISGMEQTSFVFLQAAEVGLSHAAVLRHILASACHRENVYLPPSTTPSSSQSSPSSSQSSSSVAPPAAYPLDPATAAAAAAAATDADASGGPSGRVRVYVLFGGGTSERQVSLISGTNVWLKLRARPEFEVSPLLLAPTPEGGELGDTRVWRLPYAAVLRHTVEEIVAVAEVGLRFRGPCHSSTAVHKRPVYFFNPLKL